MKFRCFGIENKMKKGCIVALRLLIDNLKIINLNVKGVWYKFDQSEIAMAELKEYNEFPSSELYDEMKLHLFSKIS